MSQKQKSILSFFKQAEPSNTNSKKSGADSDSKTVSVKSDLKKPICEDSKHLSPNGDSKHSSPNRNSKDIKKTDKPKNGCESKKSSAKKKPENSIKKDIIDDSPIKQTKKRKRAVIVESDDDSQSSDEMPNKKHETSVESNKGINGNHSHNDCNGNEDSETKQSKNISEVNSDEPQIENTNSGDPSEGQDEPMDEDQPTEKAAESKDMSDNQSKNTHLVTACEVSSTVSSSNAPEFIPKRKTARKQMRGGQQKKEVSPKMSKDSLKSSSTDVENETLDTDNGLKSVKLVIGNSSKEVTEENNESDSKSNEDVPKDNIKKELEEVVEDNNELESKSKSSVLEDDVKEDPETKETEVKGTKKQRKSSKKEAKTKETKKKATTKETKKKAATKETKKEKISSKKVKEQASDVNIESSSDNEVSSQDEKEEKSPKPKTKDTNSKKKQAIHPFFAKNKKEEASSQDESTDKKDEESTDKKDEESTDKKATKVSTTGIIYDPSKNRYHPIDDACWKHKEKVPYLALAKTLELIESISGRLKMIEALSNFFRSVIVLTPEDLLHSVYLCLNRLAPEHEGIELGIGELLLMKALAQATGRTTDKIKAEVAVKGDLGLVAESSRGNQRLMFAPPKLTVSSVFSKFKEIAKLTGNTVMSKKTDKIQALFVACRECEAKYIIRSLSGKLRIGLAEQSVLAALARAAVLTPPNQSYPPEIIDKSSKMSADSFKEYLNAQTLILKTSYCECPNYDLVIPVLLKEGIAGLPEHCQLTAGFPLKPMLAHPTNGIDEVLNRFDKNEFTCEFKYDGERAQIHRTDKGEIKVYSRNQEDTTSKYPDVLSRLPKTLKETTKSFILDTEAVAWDCETKQILPFQVLSTRKKKDAVESDIVVQVCIMAFDLIYLNGESLVKKSLKERRDQLHAAFTEVENEFMFVTYRDGNSAETMQEFLDESIKGNCEGLMVKSLTVDASYEIAKRSHNWLKLKKDYLAGVGDTLDLVVIGGYHGKGKRAGNYGGFLLACYDDDNEEFQSICKLGTGFSDVDLDTHTKFFKEHILKEPRSYYRYDSSLEPDVWFDAVQIWEIKCADLSISPIHKAAIGIVDPEKGISLRFPRFLRIRDDKTKPEDATVSSQIAEMYEKQDQVQNAKKDTKTEEDYY